MLYKFRHDKDYWGFNKQGCFTAILLLTLFLSACAVKSPLTPAEQLAHRQNLPMTWVDSPKLETIDPAFALSKDMPIDLFYAKGSKKTRYHPTQVSKKDYRLAISNADSGHAYDAFLAAYAYWSGYYKRGNIYRAQGRNHYEYRHYLKKAAHLGWPKANMILLYCSDSRTAIDLLSHHPKYALSFFCHKVDRNVSFEADTSTIQRHFFQAAKIGRHFDNDFNYVGANLPKEKSVTAVLESWRAGMESDNILATKRGYGGTSKIFPVLASVRRCRTNYAYVLDVARNFREPEVCEGRNPSGGYVFVHYTQKLDCPGAGYQDARTYLEGCMKLTRSNKDWDYYFKERMRLYHPRQDQDLKIFDAGLAHYRKVGDAEAIKWVSQLKAKAATTTMQSRDRWAREYEANEKARDLSVARRKAQEEAKAREQARAEREFGELRKRQAAQFAAEDRAKQQKWDLTTDVFNDDIDRMKGQAMQNINTQQRRLRSSSRVTLDSQKIQPGSTSNSNSKDCVHATLGYLPESRYSKSGKPWCDYDKIHRTYKNNLTERRKKNEPNDCPTGVWLGPKVLIKTGPMKGTYTRKRVYYDTGECDRQTK